ncbi:MAG: alpha/beta hydrolase-fold protein [Dehalococcoidia bacterium]|jgi:phospholipase/carboxylesterase|nr:alpha/beta hydrolase-fold protein [Dehalococcoidia bacterium]
MQFRHASLQPDGDGPFPTLIALHGHGAHALDLIGLSQFLPDNLLWLCPQAQHTLDEVLGGFTWFHFGRDDPRRDEEIGGVIEGLRGFLDAVADRYPIDPDRTALLGFSQGGMLGYRLALDEPKRFAGFAALSTTLSAESVAMVEPSEDLKQLPVLVQHGAQDPMIAVDRARESRDRLQELGVDLEYREYSMGHQVGQESANDLRAWLGGVLKLETS